MLALFFGSDGRRSLTTTDYASRIVTHTVAPSQDDLSSQVRSTYCQRNVEGVLSENLKRLPACKVRRRHSASTVARSSLRTLNMPVFYIRSHRLWPETDRGRNCGVVPISLLVD